MLSTLLVGEAKLSKPTVMYHCILSECCCCCYCQVASVVSDSVWPCRGQPTRLPRPWDSPGKNMSGLPFPSPMHESEKWKWSHSVVSDSSQPHGLQPTGLLHPWDFPGKSTGVGCHFLLQGIFLTQGSNPGLLHCRQTLYRWATRQAPRLMEEPLKDRLSGSIFLIQGMLAGHLTSLCVSQDIAQLPISKSLLFLLYQIATAVLKKDD